jgi:hypothetical protein
MEGSVGLLKNRNGVKERNADQGNAKGPLSKTEITIDGFLSPQLLNSRLGSIPDLLTSISRTERVRRLYMKMGYQYGLCLSSSHGISSLIFCLTQRSARPIPDIGI